MPTQAITQAFKRSMSSGSEGIIRGKLCIEQSEEGIVEVIQNLIDSALEGNITEDLLRQDIGIFLDVCLITPRFFYHASWR